MGGLNLAHVPYWRVNNPILWDFCVSMIGRADIEGSKSNVEERSLFALPLESTTRPKTKTEAQAPARWRIRASTFLTLDWSPKPDASSRRRLAPCSRRGGLANLDNGCGRLGRPGKFLPRRDRILPQAASSGASLHRTRFPASFLWWGMACRAWAGHRQKFLPRRSRILGLEAFQETCLHRTHFPASFLWWRMACKAWAGHRQKLPTAA